MTSPAPARRPRRPAASSRPQASVRAARAREQESASTVAPARASTLSQANPKTFHALWLITAILLIFGLCMMLSVSTAGSLTTKSGSKTGYLFDQGVTAAIGLVFTVGLAFFDYRRLRGVSLVLLVAVTGALLVLLTHLPGLTHSQNGATSWLGVGSIMLQPSEFAKLAIILGGAHFLSMGRDKMEGWRPFMKPYGIWAIAICGLVLLEPDMGTAIIVALLMVGLFWVAGMRGRHLLPLVVGGGLLGAVFLLLKSAQRGRLTSFLDPFGAKSGAGYQVVQALYGLAKGGLFGVGPGQSVQKYSYLPEAHNDMIFAVIGEELGLVGAGCVILLFIAFGFVCWRLARQCADPMGRYLIAGCGMLVVLQAVINIGGVISAMPLTGVPLPFISYGRNSLLVMLIAVGLILSVARSAPAYGVPSTAKRYKNVARIDRGRGNGRTRRSSARYS